MTLKLITSIIWIILGITGLFLDYLAAAGFILLGLGELMEYIIRKKDKFIGKLKTVSVVFQAVGFICLLIYIFIFLLDSFS